MGIVDDVLTTKAVCRIIDLGGMSDYWEGLREAWAGRAVEITIVNLTAPETIVPEFNFIEGNACSLPTIADNSYDIVHSNSVIEHVGGWTNKRKMAEETRRLAPRYFVQTPYYWFGFEPHLRTPLIHWLPRPLQRRLVMSRRSGFYRKAPSIDEAYRVLDDAEMLDATEMQELFPDARIHRERFLTFTKSLIAIR